MTTPAEENARAALARHESQNAGDPLHFSLTNHLYVALRDLLASRVKCSPSNPLCIGSERGGACSCNDGDDWPQALPTPPAITDDMAERAEIERDSHKYTLVIGSNPPRALCTCGWEGLYAGEWRTHREKAALAAALHTGGEDS